MSYQILVRATSLAGKLCWRSGADGVDNLADFLSVVDRVRPMTQKVEFTYLMSSRGLVFSTTISTTTLNKLVGSEEQ